MTGGPPATAPPQPFLKRVLREPLLHFLLAGLALFAAYQALNRGAPAQDPARVVLTEDDVRQLTESWTILWQRPPTDQELADLVENEVREEVLYREAIALGLDRGDSVVRRRLVQKMEFLAEDAPAAPDPRPEELKAWFEQNRDRFVMPPQVSFIQVYFSFFKRKDRARADAELAFDELAGLGAEAADDPSLGDRIMFQPRYQAQSREEVSRVFGAKFADAIFQLPPGEWHGPIESSYGWHVVQVEELTSPATPPFETIEPQVKYEWLADQRATARRTAYEALRSRYEVVLPPRMGR
jgi:hypothetical protein